MKLLTIPFAKGGLGKSDGAEQAPEQVIEQLKTVYCTEQGEKLTFDIVPVDVDAANFVQTHMNISALVKQTKESFIAIGGDHSVTHAIVKQLSQQNPGLGMIIFDAHPDCMQPFEPATHENFLRMLIEEGHVSPDRIILIGVRNWDEEEVKYLQEKKIRVHTMRSLTFENVEAICDAVMAQARHWPALYISVDVDAADPAFAPGVGYPEPGGMTSRDLLYFLQRLRMLKNFRAGDVVEIVPPKDVNQHTVRLGAKVVMELSGQKI